MARKIDFCNFLYLIRLFVIPLFFILDLIYFSMAFLVRFCFVVLLVLLQIVAPLIHAHKNDRIDLASSFHLPEFEQVDALLDNSSMIIAPSFHEGEIVTVSAGVKENHRRFLSNENLQVLVISFFLFIFTALKRTPHRLFTQTESIKIFHFFNSIAPRAPPYFA